jgi:cell division protein ZapA
MGEVMVTLGGRIYRVGCANNDIDRLTNIAADLETRIAALGREFGGVGEERLLLIAALLLTDELWDTRTALDAAIAEATEALRIATEPDPPQAAANGGAAPPVDKAAKG